MGQSVGRFPGSIVLACAVLAAWGSLGIPARTDSGFLKGSIHEAAYSGKLATVKKLVMRNPRLARANVPNVGTPLQWATMGNSPSVVKFLLSKGANPNATDGVGYTPLEWAGYNADGVTVANILLSAGAKVNVQDKGGNTPLHHAAFFGRPNLVKLLLERGANLRESNSSGNTPLHSVASEENRGHKFPTAEQKAAVIELLIARGADVNAKNANGATPLLVAVQAEVPKVEVVRSLRAHGADLNVTDKWGTSVNSILTTRGAKFSEELRSILSEAVTAPADPKN